MFTKQLLPTSMATGLAATALALAACGSSDGGSPSTPADREAAVLAYAQCMREHGIDMPDPQVDDRGRTRITMPGKGVPRAAMQAARKACGGKLKDAAPAPGSAEAEKAQEYGLKLAACMRKHGIDFPDPQDGRIQITPNSGLNPQGPAFQKAQAECEDQVGAPGS